MILPGDHHVGQLHTQEGREDARVGPGKHHLLLDNMVQGAVVGVLRVLSSPEAPQKGCSCPWIPGTLLWGHLHSFPSL